MGIDIQQYRASIGSFFPSGKLILKIQVQIKPNLQDLELQMYFVIHY
jgi:hypothetical protein